MGQAFLVEYFLFTFVANLAVINIAINTKDLKKVQVWSFVLILSYIWFFTSRNRSVPTVVEGSQLSFIFGVGLVAALVVANLVNKKWIFRH